MQFFSQIGQDRYLFKHYFSEIRNGVFVDIGAYDGQTFSNTLFFENTMAWSGLCVEPLPDEFKKLELCRTAACVNCCVSDYDGYGRFLDAEVVGDGKMLSGLIENYHNRHVIRIEQSLVRKNVICVPVSTLSGLLLRHNIRRVEYCSIDTEGSEFKIIQCFDFDAFHVRVLTIENNYRDSRIPELMAKKGYDFIGRFGGYDELYVLSTARSTQ